MTAREFEVEGSAVVNVVLFLYLFSVPKKTQNECDQIMLVEVGA